MDVIVVEKKITDVIEVHGDTNFVETTVQDIIEVPAIAIEQIELITEGPQGPPGPQGIPGEVGNLTQGTATGDIVRWNAATQTWESSGEPFELNGIVLTPQETAILEQEGAVYYSSTDKTIKICIGD
jgi:hypothetical protein